MITLMCDTYARPKLLNEAVECYLKQTYKGPMELIIYNDFDKISYYTKELLTKDPNKEIRLINRDRREHCHSCKLNEIIGMAKHDIIMGWTDDDIMLPRAVETAMKLIHKRHYFSAAGYYLLNGRFLRYKISEMPPGIAIYTRNTWSHAGKYTCGMRHDDLDFRSKVKAIKYYSGGAIKRENTYYILRRNSEGQNYNLSRNGWDGARALANDFFPEHQAFEINPGWQVDYERMVKECE